MAHLLHYPPQTRRTDVAALALMSYWTVVGLSRL